MADPDSDPEDDLLLPNSHDITNVLEDNYILHRDEILQEDGFIFTPLNALRAMGKEFGQNLHFDYNEIKIGIWKVYLVEVSCGIMIGRGESVRRKVAAQMAAADILQQFKQRHVETPIYGLVPGFRINPLIFGQLLILCQILEFVKPVYVQMPVDPLRKPPILYSFKCQIGQLIAIGESDNTCIAKRLSAWSMYYELSGIVIPPDRVCMGDRCTAMDRFGFKFQYSKQKAEAEAKKKELLEALKTKTKVVEEVAVPTVGPYRPPAQENDFEEDLDNEIVDGCRGLNLNSDQITEIKERVAKLNLADSCSAKLEPEAKAVGEKVEKVEGPKEEEDTMDWEAEIADVDDEECEYDLTSTDEEEEEEAEEKKYSDEEYIDLAPINQIVDECISLPYDPVFSYLGSLSSDPASSVTTTKAKVI